MQPSPQRILFVTDGLRDEGAALRELFDLMGDSIATLKILATTPTLPDRLKEFRDDLQQLMIERLEAAYDGAHPEGPNATPPVSFELVHTDQSFLTIIDMILKGDYDAVVKTAEPKSRANGYSALDMSLLRKSPTPLWLLKNHNAAPGEITVAVDPDIKESRGEALPIALLRAADHIAHSLGSSFVIVSCWVSPLGSAQRNPIFRIEDAEIEEEARELQREHMHKLTALIDEANIISPYEIVQLNGDASFLIPEHTKRVKSRVLLMGTVARTGIPGFIIGNTAEDIFQELSCSLIALKPPGFVSPISAQQPQ